MTDSDKTPPAWVAHTTAELEVRTTEWLSSRALRDLVRELAGVQAERWDYATMLAWSATTLDTRRGAERRDAQNAGWSQDWVDALIRFAPALGLIRTPPPLLESYDLCVILGGATTGNRMRVALARELIGRGTSFGRIVALAAERPLGAREHDSEPDSVNDATEWRNLLRHLTDAFGTLTPIDRHSGGARRLTWRDDLYGTSAGRPVQLLVAPSLDPGRRANSSDAVAFLRQRLAHLDGASALVITSAIYVPYQFFATGPGLLSAGLGHLELAGTPTSLTASRSVLAQRLAQEIHAALQSATRLIGGS